jgi:hypothetical protein
MKSVKNFVVKISSKSIHFLTLPVVNMIIFLYIFFVQQETDIGLVLLTSMFFFLPVYPVFISVLNLHYLFTKNHSVGKLNKAKINELFTIVLGIPSLMILGSFSDIRFADWHEQLYNAQKHFPISLDTLPTIITIFLVATVGYFIIRFLPLRKLPPLIIIFAISAIYLGIIGAVLGIIQIAAFNDFFYIFYFSLLPINFIIIAINTIITLCRNWEKIYKPYSGTNKLCLWFNRILKKAQRLPLLAFLCMFPLLGIIIAILVLFGQTPDSMIRMWTDTADWTFSQKIPPQNLRYDEHYLCTVAAGGHTKIVKPLRMGERHGNQVVVNRQLCVANAFEQVLEERIPKIHRVVRYLYDKYGYPFAKNLHSPYIADIIYFLMKPAEWFFLLVLYLFDANPENRIATQYLSKELRSKVSSVL